VFLLLFFGKMIMYFSILTVITKTSGEVKNVNRKLIFVPMIVLFMLLSVTAPVFAWNSVKSYSYGIISVATSPGSVYVDANNVEHVKGATLDATLFGTAWGTGSVIVTQNVVLDLNTYTGHIFLTSTITFGTGAAAAVGFLNFNGLGTFTYSGPTISAYGITAHNGDKFSGVLFSGTVVRYGTGGALKGLYEISQSYHGVSITISGVKYSIVNDEGIYRFT
jgi:hypothetical protein